MTTPTDIPKGPETFPTWQAQFFSSANAQERAVLDELRASGRVWEVSDTLERQLRDLMIARAPRRKELGIPAPELDALVREFLDGRTLDEYGNWAYFPWSGRLVHLLPPEEYRELRLDRNRNKITREEQARLAGLCVGVVGLSVGNAVALTLALEGACGYLKLADFDELELSNMNRVRAAVHDIGLPKTVLAARQIAEFDPYLRIELFSEGLTEGNLDAFISNSPRLDVLVDECDGLSMKVRLRERARELRIPVLMETSDRGMLDVERFDLEPTRAFFHGLVGEMSASSLKKLTNDQRKAAVLSIVGAHTMSARLGASMLEVERTIGTWPQLASAVTLGGASVTVAVRRLGLGEDVPSGRYYVDLDKLIAPSAGETSASNSRTPSAPVVQTPSALAPNALPEWLRFTLEHAILAPSAGNLQPWQFWVEGMDVWMRHDRMRSRNNLDINYRASYLAFGAALENARIAAAARGRRTEIELFPRGDTSPIIARIRFTEDAGEAEVRLAEDLTYVGQRLTNRHTGPRLPLAPEDLEDLRAAAARYNAVLRFCTQEPALTELGEIIAESDRIRFQCPPMHEELIGEVRWTAEENQRTRDGVDIETLELNSGDRAVIHLLKRADVLALSRAQDGGEALGDSSRKAVAASGALGLLCLEGDASPADYVRGGRALQSVWLRATACGLAMQPLTVVLYQIQLLHHPETASLNARERASLKDLETRLMRVFDVPVDTACLMLFRVARLPDVSTRALRRGLEQALFAGVPPEGDE